MFIISKLDGFELQNYLCALKHSDYIISLSLNLTKKKKKKKNQASINNSGKGICFSIHITVYFSFHNLTVISSS